MSLRATNPKPPGKRLLQRSLAVAACLWLGNALAEDFGSKGGPEPENIESVAEFLRQQPYDLELLISYGTSKGGSAGHLALNVRSDATDEETVYSANFYADRTEKHANGYYNADLMLGIPKAEYLFKTASSLGETASFGLDFGEIYKRSLIGIRVYDVPAEEKAALVAYFQRINDDYHRKAANTEYHDGEIKYDYLRLNCAKTIGSAFKYGAGYDDLEVSSAKLLTKRRVVVAAKSNIPTEMAMKLIKEWHARDYSMDVVWYKKYSASSYIDPHEDEQIAFMNLPDRFPSVLSRDFRRDDYRDFDNLYAMYLLYNLARYSVRVNVETQLIEIDRSKTPMPYEKAAAAAEEWARSDSRGFFLRHLFKPKGKRIGEALNNETAND